MAVVAAFGIRCPTRRLMTLTFVLTDVEGSTRLWEAHRQAMEGALARHDLSLIHI